MNEGETSETVPMGSPLPYETVSDTSPHTIGAHFTLESLPGTTLDGRYVVEELLGMGAMGAVFKGRHTRLRRTVALKIPRIELYRKPGFLGRFEREALTMAKLVQENIVQVFDVFISDDPAKPSFIAMEYVEGVELEEFIHNPEMKLTVAQVMDLFFQIARGLDAAHERGIIHRDIKPKNIYVTLPERAAKIMDFGVAKLEMEDVYETAANSAIGTPAYMAPEQITGDDLTPAADIYGLAMTMYRALTRKLPFEANSASNMLFAHVSTVPIAAHARNPYLPIKVHKALSQGLAKNPKERPATARALVVAVYKSLEHLAERPFADLFNGNITTDEANPADPNQGMATEIELPRVPFVTVTTDTRRHAKIAGAAAAALILIFSAWVMMRSPTADSEREIAVRAAENADLTPFRPASNPAANLDKPLSATPEEASNREPNAAVPSAVPNEFASYASTPENGTTAPPPPITVETTSNITSSTMDTTIAAATLHPIESKPAEPPQGSGTGAEPVEPALVPASPMPEPPPESAPAEAAVPPKPKPPKPAAKEEPAPKKTESSPVESAPSDAQSYAEMDAARWDTKLYPGESVAWRREQMRSSIEKFFESDIEKPVFRGEFDRKSNALARTGGRTASDLLAKLRELNKSNGQISISFQIMDGGKYWTDRAEIKVSVKVTGHPLDNPDPNYRRTLIAYSSPVPVRVQKMGDTWGLLSFNNH